MTAATMMPWGQGLMIPSTPVPYVFAGCELKSLKQLERLLQH